MTTVISDPRGQRRLGGMPGLSRMIGDAERGVWRSQPLVPATSRLLWRVVPNQAQLSPDGCRLAARVLALAARAGEQLRTVLAGDTVPVQLLVGLVATRAREAARDLGVLALSATGTVEAGLAGELRQRLDQAEQGDPLLAPPSDALLAAAEAVAIAIPAARAAEPFAVLLPLYDELLGVAAAIEVRGEGARFLLDSVTVGRLAWALLAGEGPRLTPALSTLLGAAQTFQVALGHIYSVQSLIEPAVLVIDGLTFWDSAAGGPPPGMTG